MIVFLAKNGSPEGFDHFNVEASGVAFLPKQMSGSFLEKLLCGAGPIGAPSSN